MIAPGPIADTEGVARLSKAEGREENARGIPTGRYGTVKEIADATVYLFSDTGNYVNGETIVGELATFLTASRFNSCANDARVQWMADSGIQLAWGMRSSSIPTFCSRERLLRALLARRRRSCRRMMYMVPLSKRYRGHCFQLLLFRL